MKTRSSLLLPLIVAAPLFGQDLPVRLESTTRASSTKPTATRTPQRSARRKPAAKTAKTSSKPGQKLGKSHRLWPGVVLHSSVARTPSGWMNIWMYRPDPWPASRVPCVLIAPAGSRLFHGGRLGNGDVAEHLPYVRAGMAVVAYELDGEIRDENSIEDKIDAAYEFRLAEGGLLNARRALDWALANEPHIDRSRIFCAGHSSAATVALWVAANEKRVRGCVAFAPATELRSALGGMFLAQLEAADPGHTAFVTRTDPSVFAPRLKAPTLLFHARDDSNVPFAQSQRFATRLRRTNSRLSFVAAPSGDHYNSMIQSGIPTAIRWIKGFAPS